MLFGYTGVSLQNNVISQAWADDGGSPRTFTITGTTTVDASAGVFGVELSAPDGATLLWSENAVGTAANQTITITGADYGYVNASVVTYRCYYNENTLDPVATRKYGTILTYTVPTV